jgi:NADH-quinone oxidoreductase subunit J
MVLFSQFTLPFEIASLILLAAIVGAVVVAKRKIDS